ncbi:uncharacterized protein SAPINGB_P000815 [Magnusiomyces paraingens]|uniref:Uncharacterized protein n=1 Tax=Magnusiomyces paraingens TaxID=2606893 RepID=A0A5E8B329_9ASCO|nr:uncharacterized protein SAPINGB_P000815 [Saprochaete ingens]VVT45619.1 unnamed protein product [Saprochaete ingens]
MIKTILCSYSIIGALIPQRSSYNIVNDQNISNINSNPQQLSNKNDTIIESQSAFQNEKDDIEDGDGIIRRKKANTIKPLGSSNRHGYYSKTVVFIALLLLAIIGPGINIAVSRSVSREIRYRYISAQQCSSLNDCGNHDYGNYSQLETDHNSLRGLLYNCLNGNYTRVYQDKLSMSDAITYKINSQVGVSNVTTQGTYEINQYSSGFSLPRITLTQLAINLNDVNQIGWPTDSQDIFVDVVPPENVIQDQIMSQIASLAYTNNTLRSTGVTGSRTLRNIHIQYNGSAIEGNNKMCLTTALVKIDVNEYYVGGVSNAGTYSRINSSDNEITSYMGGDDCMITPISIYNDNSEAYDSASGFLNDISANNDTLDSILTEKYYANCATDNTNTTSILQVRKVYSSTGMGSSQSVMIDIITLNQTRQVYCDTVSPQLVQRKPIYTSDSPGYIASGVGVNLLSVYTDTKDSDDDLLDVSGLNNFVKYQYVTTTAVTYYNVKVQVIVLLCLLGVTILLKVILVYKTIGEPNIVDVVKEVVLDGYCYVNPFTVFTKNYDLREVSCGAYYDSVKNVNHCGIVYNDTVYEQPRSNVSWGSRFGMSRT